MDKDKQIAAIVKRMSFYKVYMDIETGNEFTKELYHYLSQFYAKIEKEFKTRAR